MKTRHVNIDINVVTQLSGELENAGIDNKTVVHILDTAKRTYKDLKV